MEGFGPFFNILARIDHNLVFFFPIDLFQEIKEETRIIVIDARIINGPKEKDV